MATLRENNAAFLQQPVDFALMHKTYLYQRLIDRLIISQNVNRETYNWKHDPHESPHHEADLSDTALEGVLWTRLIQLFCNCGNKCFCVGCRM